MSKNLRFYCLGGLFSLLFLITRCIYYFDLYIPGITPDSFTYFQPVYELHNFQIPLFDLRTPGYPLFLAIASAITFSLKQVFILQSILSYIVLLTAIWEIQKLPRFNVSLSLGVTLISLNTTYLIWETSYNPIFLFTSLLILLSILLVAALYGNEKRNLFISTLILAYLAFLRPQGVFVYPLYFSVILYLLLRKRVSLRSFLTDNILLMLPILISPIYNKLTTGTSTSRFNTVTNYCLISKFIYPDSSLPPNLNQAVKNASIYYTPQELNIIHSSWDFDTLSNIITVKNYDCGWILTKAISEEYGSPFYNFERLPIEVKQTAQKIALSHLELYPKFILTNIYSTFLLLTKPEKFPLFRNLQANAYYLLDKSSYSNIDSGLIKATLKESVYYYDRSNDTVLSGNYAIFLSINKELHWSYDELSFSVKLLYLFEYYSEPFFHSKFFFLLTIASLLLIIYHFPKFGFIFVSIFGLNLLLTASLIPPLPRYNLTYYFFFIVVPLMSLELIAAKLYFFHHN